MFLSLVLIVTGEGAREQCPRSIGTPYTPHGLVKY